MRDKPRAFLDSTEVTQLLVSSPPVSAGPQDELRLCPSRWGEAGTPGEAGTLAQRDHSGWSGESPGLSQLASLSLSFPVSESIRQRSWRFFLIPGKDFSRSPPGRARASALL